MIAVADTVKDDSRSAIAEMKRQNLKVVMITGDNRENCTCNQVMAGVGICSIKLFQDGKRKPDKGTWKT